MGSLVARSIAARTGEWPEKMKVTSRALTKTAGVSDRCGRMVGPPGILGAMIDQLRAAAEALNRGDPEPFASLFAEDAEWRGISHGFLWWKRTPT